MADDKRMGGYDDSELGIEKLPGIPKTGTIMCLALNEQSYNERKKLLKKNTLIQLKREKDAYEQGKPAKLVELERLDGSKTKEEIAFSNIEDFEPESFPTKIPYLHTINDEKIMLEDALGLIQNEEDFRDAFSDPKRRRALGQLFQRLAQALENV